MGILFDAATDKRVSHQRITILGVITSQNGTSLEELALMN
jgi:hypothetical protein